MKHKKKIITLVVTGVAYAIGHFSGISTEDLLVHVNSIVEVLLTLGV